MTLRLLLAALGLLARDAHEPADVRAARLERADRAALSAAGANRELYRALIVLGGLETGFAERFARDACRPNECDRGRAKHYWQLHRACCPPLWDEPTDVRIAATCAANMLRFGRRECGDWAGAFCVYAGLGCGCKLGRERAAVLARAGGST